MDCVWLVYVFDLANILPYVVVIIHLLVWFKLGMVPDIAKFGLS